MPLWVIAGHKGLLGRLAVEAEVASGLLETTVRLLGMAGTKVSAVDIEPASDDVPELCSDTAAARVGLATATGTRPVTVSAEYGLALAAAGRGRALPHPRIPAALATARIPPWPGERASTRPANDAAAHRDAETTPRTSPPPAPRHPQGSL